MQRALLAQRLRVADHAPLGHVVDAGPERGVRPGDRGDVDDVPSPAVAHQRQRVVGAVEEPEAVDLDHPPPLARVGALERAEQHHAGVVDQAVEPAELGVRGLDQRPGLLLVGDVGLDRDRRAAVGVDPRRRASSRRSLRRAPSATAAPSATIATAVASPIPDEAPVISALRPSSDPAIAASLYGGLARITARASPERSPPRR